MKYLKKVIAIILSTTMVFYTLFTCFAEDVDSNNILMELKTVEQTETTENYSKKEPESSDKVDTSLISYLEGNESEYIEVSTDSELIDALKNYDDDIESESIEVDNYPIASSSEVDEDIDDLIVSDDNVATISSIGEETFGAEEPWMWWYLTDEEHTIHFSNSMPASGGTGITGNEIEYSGFYKNYVERAVFDNAIVARSCYGLFSGFCELTSIDNIEYLDTSNTTSMSKMFKECEKLTSIDVSGFVTNSVTDMSYMFCGCSSLENLDLSNFDTNNVKNMSYMFAGGDNSEEGATTDITSIDLSSFNTQNVTNMSSMFCGCDNVKLLWVLKVKKYIFIIVFY